MDLSQFGEIMWYEYVISLIILGFILYLKT